MLFKLKAFYSEILIGQCHLSENGVHPVKFDDSWTLQINLSSFANFVSAISPKEMIT